MRARSQQDCGLCADHESDTPQKNTLLNKTSLEKAPTEREETTRGTPRKDRIRVAPVTSDPKHAQVNRKEKWHVHVISGTVQLTT